MAYPTCSFQTKFGKLSAILEESTLDHAAAHCRSIGQQLFNINTLEAFEILNRELTNCAGDFPLTQFHSGLQMYRGAGRWQDGKIFNISKSELPDWFVNPMFVAGSWRCLQGEFSPIDGKIYLGPCDYELSFLCMETDTNNLPAPTVSPCVETRESSDILEHLSSFQTKYGKMNVFEGPSTLNQAVDYCRSINQELFNINTLEAFEILKRELTERSLDLEQLHSGLKLYHGAGYWQDGTPFNIPKSELPNWIVDHIAVNENVKCGQAEYSADDGKLFLGSCKNKLGFLCVDKGDVTTASQVMSTTSQSDTYVSGAGSDYQASSLSALHGDMNDVQNVEDGYSWQHIFFIMMVASLVIFIVGFIARSWIRKRKAKRSNDEDSVMHSRGTLQFMDSEVGVTENV